MVHGCGAVFFVCATAYAALWLNTGDSKLKDMFFRDIGDHQLELIAGGITGSVYAAYQNFFANR